MRKFVSKVVMMVLSFLKNGKNKTFRSWFCKRISLCRNNCQLYFEALDLVITGITDHFDQPSYVIYKSLEGLLVKAASNLPYDEYLSEVR